MHRHVDTFDRADDPELHDAADDGIVDVAAKRFTPADWLIRAVPVTVPQQVHEPDLVVVEGS